MNKTTCRRAGDVPRRQNRRTPLIEAALALVFGTESMIVLSDVLQLDEDQARAVKQ